MHKALAALKHKYLGQKAQALFQLEVYLGNPVGVGEHSDIVGEIEKNVAAVAKADEMLSTIDSIVSTPPADKPE